MRRRWQLALNNRLIAWAGVLGIGLLPCPDCGLPLAIKVWPLAGLFWVFQRVRRRSERHLDLWLLDGCHHHEHQPSESPAADQPPSGT
ncbi:MAG: hypothetical protein ACUVSU_15135 [Aggregatilineaceae bacterium]